MNVRRLIGLLLLSLLSQPLNAQWRILYKSQDILQPITTPILADTAALISLIEPRGAWSKYLIIRYAHAKRKLVPKKSVWGFADSTNAIWRVYANDLCRVLKYNGAWVEYAIFCSRTNRNGRPTVWYEFAYSRTLDSKIWDHWSQAMADVPPGYILR